MKPLLAILVLDQHFNFTLGIFQNFQAALRKTDTFFEDLQRLVQRQVALLQFADYRLQSSHRLFELYSAHDRARPFMKCVVSLYPVMGSFLN